MLSEITQTAIRNSETETSGELSVTAKMTTSFKLSAPVFGREKKLEQHTTEIEVWCAVQHGVPKKDQTLVLCRMCHLAI